MNSSPVEQNRGTDSLHIKVSGVVCLLFSEMWSMGGGSLAPCLHPGQVFPDSVLHMGPSCRASSPSFCRNPNGRISAPPSTHGG